jgi:hypothetical protein
MLQTKVRTEEQELTLLKTDEHVIKLRIGNTKAETNACTTGRADNEE